MGKTKFRFIGTDTEGEKLFRKLGSSFVFGLKKKK